MPRYVATLNEMIGKIPRTSEWQNIDKLGAGAGKGLKWNASYPITIGIGTKSLVARHEPYPQKEIQLIGGSLPIQ